ncbi:hypothetical protein AN958_06485 [Leucoagaricus sp. SymC.cos]|nr:hypothetical protein AN958_06485 [Leucoagaricus sp. SymC.cos]
MNRAENMGMPLLILSPFHFFQPRLNTNANSTSCYLLTPSIIGISITPGSSTFSLKTPPLSVAPTKKNELLDLLTLFSYARGTSAPGTGSIESVTARQKIERRD